MLSYIEINEYNDKKSVSVRVKDIRRSDFPQDKYFAARNFYEKSSEAKKQIQGFLNVSCPIRRI